jgi:hypothetical protein
MPAEIGYVLVRLTDGCPASIGRGGLVGRNGALSKSSSVGPRRATLRRTKNHRPLSRPVVEGVLRDHCFMTRATSCFKR